MAKKIDPLKAKQAKQKKMAIGLTVMFVAVLAYQGPKMLKLFQGPAAAPVAETAAAPTSVTSTTASGAVPPGTPGAPATATGAPTPVDAQPAVLADSDLPVAAGAGQLLSFERFESVDPFDQQVDPDAIPAAPQSSGAGAKPAAAAAGGTDAEKPAAGAKTGSVAPGTGAGTTGGGSGSPTTAFTPPATATSLSLNGAVVELTAAAEFPVDDPVFVFVSAAADGKSIEIGIAGGVYADGAETITLKLGKPLTLQNTADGSRYELKLLTVQGFVPPKPKK